jgi:hypothetical protein
MWITIIGLSAKISFVKFQIQALQNLVIWLLKIWSKWRPPSQQQGGQILPVEDVQGIRGGKKNPIQYYNMCKYGAQVSSPGEDVPVLPWDILRENDILDFMVKIRIFRSKFSPRSPQSPRAGSWWPSRLTGSLLSCHSSWWGQTYYAPGNNAPGGGRVGGWRAWRWWRSSGLWLVWLAILNNLCSTYWKLRLFLILKILQTIFNYNAKNRVFQSDWSSNWEVKSFWTKSSNVQFSLQ